MYNYLLTIIGYIPNTRLINILKCTYSHPCYIIYNRPIEVCGHRKYAARTGTEFLQVLCEIFDILEKWKQIFIFLKFY